MAASLAPDYLVFDGGTNPDGTVSSPRRPSTDDLGGAEKLDDDEFPPDPVEMPDAGGHNQTTKVVSRIAGMTAAAKLEVRFASGAPYVNRADGLGTAIDPDTFTPTDNGTGDTTIEWPADTFPPEVVSPNGLTLYSSSTNPVTGHVEEVTNGVRVRTFVNGVAADVDWSLNLN